MASTYTNLGIELMADGEKANTWGTVTNTNWEMTEEALTGKAIITISGNYTLSGYSDGVASNNARKFYVRFEGSLSGTATITLPTNDKIYGVVNATTGNQSITLTCGSGDNVTIENGKGALIHTSVTGQHVHSLSSEGTSSTVTDAIAKIPSSWTSSAQSILGLTDTPASYSGQAGKILKVNSGATALEFAADDAGSGSGGDAATLGGQNSAYHLAYANFTGIPTIPTTTSQLTNNSGFWASMSSFVSGGGATYGGVGTYVFATVNNSTDYPPGTSSISGSSLRPAGAVTINSSGNSGPTAEIETSGPSGTWRAMGNRHASNTGWAGATYVATLFVRTS